ncbi:MBL fold metallo-hydrolase [Lachnospiraceae bacterium]|nr:MBL fold metallo-hydrolase [Lachnospiraceae bacterium]
MKLSKRIYQLSGVPYGTNSNAYAIDAGDRVILIDAGFSEKQWDIMMKTLAYWKLDDKPIANTLFTHCHFDHAGNAYLAKAAGSRIAMGIQDAEAVSRGDERTIGHLFGREFMPVSVDDILQGEVELAIGDVHISCIPMPGHTEGSYMFQMKEEEGNFLFMGDFIAIDPLPPEDEVTLRLAWTGAPDYNREDYLNSLKRACALDSSILLPGHYYCYYGDSSKIFEMAYELGKKEL